MKAINFISLFIIILILLVFNGCTKTISEEQKTVENEIMAFLTSMDEAASQQDWTKINRIVEEYFARDILIRAEDPNRKNQQVRIIPLQQYRFMLQQAPQVIFDYKLKAKNRKIKVAPDGKSAKVIARHVEITTMRRDAAFVVAPYLLEGENMATLEPQVTIKNEEQVTMQFEYRESKLFITQIDSKVINAELIER